MRPLPFSRLTHLPAVCAHVADGNLHCMTPYTSDAEAVVVHTLEGALIDRALAAGAPRMERWMMIRIALTRRCVA